MEGGTDYTKDPVQEKYNADGTINKMWTPASTGAYADEKGPDLKAGETTGDDERKYKRKAQDEKRAQANLDRAQAAANKRRARRGGAKASPAAVHFAPYTDKVREAKRKQAKRLKIMKKRAYYDGSM